MTFPIIDIYNEKIINEYKSKTNMEIYVPKVSSSIPTESDYIRGYYYRYFYKHATNKYATVYELKESEYNKIIDIYLYKTLKIKWKLIGNKEDTKNINSKILDNSDNILYGIKSCIIDPLQYWKNIPDIVTQFDATNKIPVKL